MIDPPQVTQSATQLTAIIRLTLPRNEIQNVMGPGIGELMATVAAQGIAVAGHVLSSLKFTANLLEHIQADRNTLLGEPYGKSIQKDLVNVAHLFPKRPPLSAKADENGPMIVTVGHLLHPLRMRQAAKRLVNVLPA